MDDRSERLSIPGTTGQGAAGRPAEPPPLPQWYLRQAELAGPAVGRDRLASLDVLRGVAVLGILVMNIQSFSMIEAAYFNPLAYGDLTGWNWRIWLIGHLLFEGKFISIFSMLFGAGIVLMAGRREASGRRPAAVHYRRMGILLVIGLLHGYLFWYGDILFYYAVAGMVVYLCWRWRPLWQILLGLAGLLIAWGVWLALEWAYPHLPPEVQQEMALMIWPSEQMVAEELAAYRGGWWSQMSHRAPTLIGYQTWGMISFMFWWACGMMLLGMALFKLGLFSAAAPLKVYLGLLLAAAAGIALILLGVQQRYGPDAAAEPLIMTNYNYWPALLVGLGWVSVVMLALRGRLLAAGQRGMAAVGRMALTNYLLQTLICTTIFYGHGFGLFGRVERTGQAAIVAAVWVFQIIFSVLWMKRFEYGPAEWLWRAATYGTAPPLLRTADLSNSAAHAASSGPSGG